MRTPQLSNELTSNPRVTVTPDGVEIAATFTGRPAPWTVRWNSEFFVWELYSAIITIPIERDADPNVLVGIALAARND